MTKILGKYEIISEESGTLKIARYNDCDYRIEIVPKTSASGKYSNIAKNINLVSHQNISNLKIEEDDRNFYFVDKNFDEGYSELKPEWFGSNYVSLIKCYQQIVDAVEYIHQKGFYHGNINPKNILIDREDHAYLLDFGRCYIYAMMNGSPDKRFYAPEQRALNECRKESDIYSLGLCMLDLLLESHFDSFKFSETYKDFDSLEEIYRCIAEHEEQLDKTNAELLIIIKAMLNADPEERIKLLDVRRKLNDLLREIMPNKTFGIQIGGRVLEKWRENHDCEQYVEKEDIRERIEDYRAYLEFGKDKSDRDEIKIAIGDLTFCCSAKENSHYFFCFGILESPSKTELLQKYGLPTDDMFKILGPNEHDWSCDDAGSVIEKLKERYEQKKRENERYETDSKSIATEEELLKAEKRTIDEKKNTRKVILKELNRGDDTLTLEYIIDKDENKSENYTTENTRENIPSEKDFKQKQDVLLQENLKSDEVLKGVVERSESGFSVTVKVGKYEVAKYADDQKKEFHLEKGAEYFLSYDYQAEEAVWTKKDCALYQLQNGNVYIHNFLRKINRPQEFIKNDLIDVEKFYNTSLDENQQLAVRKALSLDDKCELMVLQGPPGTGKTVTITEIVTQLLKTRPHEKILVASQSNQAVDNVLEKICGIEDKILRIGNDETKISKTAQNYLPHKVLNKIIQDNIKRIDGNSVSHTNEGIQNKMTELQKDFREQLQHITSQMGNNSKNGETNKETELAALFTQNIRLVFGTLIGISSWKSFREIVFDTVIVDEAGRATLSELLVPCIKARKLILVGDHKQLAPVIDDDVLEKIKDRDEAKTSFFQRVFERIQNADRPNLLHTLNHNYRSESRICDLYNIPFYNGELKTTDAVNAQKKHSLSFRSSVVWYDTGMLPDKEDEQEGTGKINRCNASVIEKTLRRIQTEMKNCGMNYDIGIITPYKAQAAALRKKLAVKKNFAECSIEIGTVDSFQGSDRDIIIYDCVRSGKLKGKAKIDFIADEKRLNVSLSRAKKLLIIVGDMDFLYQAKVSDKNNPFENIIEYINQNKESYEVIKLGEKHD
ncbi:AAA family ATPase [bacterium]|nr:AAA family ATPase [bacterium]